MNDNIGFGFFMILIAAVCGGAFGLQYTILRRYTVDNAALLSLFFATIVVPLIAINIYLPGWTLALRSAGLQANLLVFVFGFGWGLGAFTYALAFNLLGMALAAAIIKGLTISIGAGIPLIRTWDTVSPDARTFTVIGIAILLVGTFISGRAGILREREAERKRASADHPTLDAVGKGKNLFFIGFLMCLLSGVLSAFVNLGYDFGDTLEAAMVRQSGLEDLTWKATLIRWMPMYWGGITALLLTTGIRMYRNGTWRNYFGPGASRDFCLAAGMGIVHFMAQIPYGVGAYYLGKLGTSVGFGANIGMALIVAASLGFLTGEWKGVSRKAVSLILAGIGVIMVALLTLAYANSLQ